MVHPGLLTVMALAAKRQKVYSSAESTQGFSAGTGGDRNFAGLLQQGKAALFNSLYLASMHPATHTLSILLEQLLMWMQVCGTMHLSCCSLDESSQTVFDRSSCHSPWRFLPSLGQPRLCAVCHLSYQ